MSDGKTKIDRTMSGLRNGLFELYEDVRDKRCDVEIGRTCMGIAKVIVDSVKVQIAYEQLRLKSEVPSHLPDMKLLPPLGK